MSTDAEEPIHVQIALKSRADQRLLVRLLRDAGLTPHAVALPDQRADLVIVDASAWEHACEQLRVAREHAHPIVFPVLAIAGKEAASAAWAYRELGAHIDDLVELPTSRTVLLSRVGNLLRLRRLSLAQAHDHRSTQQQLNAVNRAFETLHACNEMMVRESTEDGLLQSVCEAIAQFEGYALAWVGFANDDKQVTKCYIAGKAADYAQAIEVNVDGSPKSQGPIGQAIVSGSTQIVSDMRADPRMAPWREQIIARDLSAVIALPLKVSAGPSGVLAVYSKRSGDFATDERALLERLADNLTVGLDRLRLQNERKAQSQEIQRLAYQDPVTGMANRRSLLDRLNRLVTQADHDQAAAILFIDLDDFKLVNDVLGHKLGDSVLQNVAWRISNTLRDGDIVARQGGDEFIVVMVDAPRYPPPDEESVRTRLTRGADELAQRIHRTLCQPFEIDGHAHRLGASIGISLLPFLSDTPETVIDQADMAMYAAKHSGQGTAFFSPELAAGRQQRLSLEAKLHHALTAGELQLNYQPVWELDSGRIIAVEALLRWRDDEGHMISPATFIPVAEEIGLMGALSEWVIEEAARQLASWREAGLELTMGVNLSVSQLQGPEAARAIHDQIVALGSDPRWWLLELTEEAVMKTPEAVMEAMRLLSDAGFRLALDDFGRGYSSLARLQAMPLHTLKIDKLFVDSLQEEVPDDRVVRTVVELARQFSLRVVAEGIEHIEQAQQLAKMGCSFGQGFWVSPAIPASEIPALMQGRVSPMH
ncbi:diguanylate cyclase (GGDEF)-like protein [Chromohalobacter marismortui]|uniref:Diguanylate cyclase (GGDEF)-like protein n=2 Tax=Chromohalobacter TaxID=42054 RepID=A0A4R7NIM0_9GAMM|nr:MULTISPECIES: EAL domain-containing protein [Chromohalobacter]MCI0592705.1 EAL domain-containing protein [Chromohalobacter sp.]TDU20239.1 diguanylate cyclase (GGDEF)-like protein [Chromohalobacter marismortui]